MERLGTLSYRKMKTIYQFMLISIGVYFLSSLFLFYLDKKFVNIVPPMMDKMKLPREKQKINRALDSYKIIWERNLFAVKIDEKKTESPDDLITQIDKLSLTSLNLNLIGTVIRKSGNSWAIIQDNQSKHQDKYTVGSIVNGAKVVMILRNRVVLNRDGKDELLVMGIEKIRADQADNKRPGKKSPPGEVSSFTVTKAFMQNSINNVAQIMAKVRVKPHFVKGKPAGFRISRIKKGSLFSTMGFKDGDIINGVNGRDIKSAQDIMRIYNSMKDSRFFSVHINRNNQQKILNYKVR
ncbi:type II secretion system protein N [Thermodesulfobacteriota bacterium]